MGSLSNLYISQSYQSLLHTGNNSALTTQSVEIQDGLGNGTGIYINTLGSISMSGNIYAANLTGSTIDTSSFVTNTSFNAYTQSINQFTASISTSVGLLQTFSGSQYKADSASFSSRIESIQPTGYVTTASFNSYTASQDFKNGTFATTSSLNSLSSSAASALDGLSASLYQTDVTQSNNLTTLSSSVYNQFSASSAGTAGLSASVATTINNLSASIYQTDSTQSTNLTTLSSSVYTQFSASTANVLALSTSVDSRLDSIEFLDTTFATTASLNSLSASIYQTDSTQSNNLTTLSSSVYTQFSASNASELALSASLDSRINALVLSGSVLTIEDEGIILGTATTLNFVGSAVSVSVNTSTASVSINTSDLVTTSSFNSYSSSAASTISTLSASIFQTDATQSNNISNLSASNAFDHSRFATTGSNTFNGDQNIIGAITASSLIATNATITYLHTIYESSSVVYSSGSNQLGDDITDTQTLYGQVNVVNQLTASGLHYPTADGAFTGQVLQTNAAGTLSFGNVNAVFETIHNGESTTLTVGTPLYVSGAQGSNPICYRADATNPAKMPVTFVAMESIAANQNGRGITLGLITGINLTGYAVGEDLWVDGVGALTNIRPTGSNDIIQPIGIVTKTGPGGQLNVLNPGPVLLPNIQTGYLWVGNGSNQPVSLATSSFEVSGSTYALSASIYQTDVTQSQNIATLSSSVYTQFSASTAGELALSTSVASRLSTIEFLDTTFATTTSVSDLSASVYQTDVTQSQNFTTFSSSYVVESASFSGRIDGKINGVTLLDDSAIVGVGIPALNFGSNIAVSVAGVTGSISLFGLATTGSNTFTGNQTINGALQISSSATYDIDVTGSLQTNNQLRVSSSAGTNTMQATQTLLQSGSYTTVVSRLQLVNQSGSNAIGFVAGPANAGNAMLAPSPSIMLHSGSSTTTTTASVYYPIQFQNGASYTDGRVTIATPLSASAGITSSNAYLNGELYSVTSASFDSRISSIVSGIQTQEEGTILGNATSINFIGSGVTASYSAGTASVTINTSPIDVSTLATTGSNTFVGNQIFSGSVRGVVTALSITSQTASMDCSLGNFFTLTLASGTNTHISCSNINPGETISLRVIQSSSSVGSVTFEPTIKFSQFAPYVASQVTSSVDILSFLSFDTSALYGVAVNSLI